MPLSRLSPKRTARTAAVALALLVALGTATPAYAQADAPARADALAESCDRVEGTIQVADDARNMQAMAKVTHEQASEAALAALPGATVQDTDLEEEDGYLVYEVDLVMNGQEHDAYVDAGSGAVLCMERED